MYNSYISIKTPTRQKGSFGINKQIYTWKYVKVYVKSGQSLFRSNEISDFYFH